MKGETGKTGAGALYGEGGEEGIHNTKILFEKVMWNYINGYLKLHIYKYTYITYMQYIWKEKEGNNASCTN